MRIALAFGLAWAAGACLPRGVFGCEVDEQCDGSGAERGRCEAGGYCSFADEDCESGRRYDRYAGNSQRGLCVAPDPEGTSTGVLTTSTSTGALTTSTQASSSGVAESSTTGAPRCGDGNLDEGEACDDGNSVNADGCNVDCRTSGDEVWTRVHSTPGGEDDKAFDVAIRSDANIVVVGEVGTENVDSDIWVRQYDPDGAEVWTFTLDEQEGDGNSEDIAWAVTPTDSGSVLVVGYVTLADTGEDFWIGEIDAQGLLLWDETFDAAGDARDNGRGIARYEDGDIVVTGSIGAVEGESQDHLTRRYGPMAGDVRWDVTFSAPAMQFDRGHAVALTIGGDVISCGLFRNAANVNQWSLFRYSGAGEELFVDPYGAGDAESACVDAVALESGGYVAVGAMADDMVIRAYNTSDELRWQVDVASPNDDADKANAVAVDSEGNVIVAGELGAGAGSTDAWIGKYDPEGAELWTATNSGSAGQRDTAWGVAVAPNDEIVVVGYEEVPGEGRDIWVRKYTP